MKLVIRFKLRYKKGRPQTVPYFVEIRLRVNGIAAKSAIATGISCLPTEWNAKQQRIVGRGPEIQEKNQRLANIEADLLMNFNLLRSQNKPVSAEILKAIYMGKARTVPATVLGFYRFFVDRHMANVVKDTARHWESKINVLTKYVQKFLKRKDIDLAEITPTWGIDFYEYCIKHNHTGKTTAARAVSALRQVLNQAIVEGVLLVNPLAVLRLKRDRTKPIKFLSQTQLEKLAKCPYYDDRLQKVVDCFCFQAYTGMAYNELLHFDHKKHLKTDTKGVTWIMIHRGKTTELSTIPLLASARALMEKYGYKLPVVTNQKMNDYIKEAATIAGLDNVGEISTHVARKTAGMYLLNAGLRMESVSKILGHKSVKVTERYYATLQTDGLSDDLRKNGLI